MPCWTKCDQKVPVTLIKIQAFTMFKLHSYPCWELMLKHVSKKGGNCNATTTSLLLSSGRCMGMRGSINVCEEGKIKKPLAVVTESTVTSLLEKERKYKGYMLWLQWNPTEEFYSACTFLKATHFTLSLFHCTWQRKEEKPHIAPQEVSPQEILTSPLLALLMLIRAVCQATFTSTLPCLTATLCHKSFQRSYPAPWGFSFSLLAAQRFSALLIISTLRYKFTKIDGVLRPQLQGNRRLL